MTIEDKIRKISLAPVTEHDFDGKVDEYFYKLCVKAYNLGVEEAADNVKTTVFMDGYSQKEVVDKESILKLRI